MPVLVSAQRDWQQPLEQCQVDPRCFAELTKHPGLVPPAACDFPCSILVVDVTARLTLGALSTLSRRAAGVASPTIGTFAVASLDVDSELVVDLGG